MSSLTSMASRYRQDGFVVVPGVFDQAAVTACIEHLQVLQGGGDEGGPIVTADLSSDSFLARTAEDPRLVAIAGCLLEAAPAPFGCTYFVKPSRVGLPVLWHQDGYPWQSGLGIAEAITLWIALDPVGEHNGGPRVIPGSHLLAAQPLRPNRERPNVFGAEIDPGLVDTTLARQITLAAGALSAHHPNLIHGSLPNRSDRPRRALAVRYRPA
jgi:hypothetical protein